MKLIWEKEKAENFCGQDWTDEIKLIPQVNFSSIVIAQHDMAPVLALAPSSGQKRNWRGATAGRPRILIPNDDNCGNNSGKSC